MNTKTDDLGIDGLPTNFVHPNESSLIDALELFLVQYANRTHWSVSDNCQEQGLPSDLRLTYHPHRFVDGYTFAEQALTKIRLFRYSKIDEQPPKIIEDMINHIASSISETENCDDVNHPSHYTSHPSGVECVDITEHYPSNIGNVIKYVWRAGLKNDSDESSLPRSEIKSSLQKSKIKDLKKAQFYLNREIEKLEREQSQVN